MMSASLFSADVVLYILTLYIALCAITACPRYPLTSLQKRFCSLCKVNWWIHIASALREPTVTKEELGPTK